MKKLFIAEKPSLAQALAGELGPAVKKDNYYQVGDCYVAWLYGHILRTCEPAEYADKYKTWQLEDLPIIPSQWKNKVQSGEAYLKALETIKKLSQEVDIIVHAGDPDREGQLLVDEVLEFINNKKPVERILINALDSTSIQRALNNLEDNSLPTHYNRYQSALARQRTDWLWGLNATRKFTLEAQKNGNKGALKVGRVKTPTLALVIARNKAVAEFAAVKHYGINCYFTPHNDIAFSAKWIPPENFPIDEEGRIINIIAIREIEQKLTNSSRIGIVSEIECTVENKNPPKPFNLAKLQLAAGNLYNINPAKTLELAQSLYEKKLISYPRSSCEYIPESQHADSKNIIANLKLSGLKSISEWCEEAIPTRKISAFNDKKIDSHHAIIPTLIKSDICSLPHQEQLIYILIARNYLSQFYAAYSVSRTSVKIEVDNELFLAAGKTILVDGWKKLFNSEENEPEDLSEFQNKKLSVLQKGQEIDLSVIKLVDKLTTPPKQYTQSTLLSAMENIYLYVKDETLRSILKDTKGIGTDATRAGIIKDLLDSNLVVEEGSKSKKYLVATEAGKSVIKALPENVTLPDFTAKMEIELEAIAQGEKTLTEYMAAQEKAITELMKVSSNIKIQQKTVKCPLCSIGSLIKRVFDKSIVWVCSDWKNGCKANFKNKKDEPMIIQCPTCKKGVLLTKKGSKSVFWGCSKYPDCKAMFYDKSGKPVLNKK